MGVERVGCHLPPSDARFVDIYHVHEHLWDYSKAIAFLRCVYLADEWDAFPAPRMINRSTEQRAAIEPLIANYNQAFMMN